MHRVVELRQWSQRVIASKWPSQASRGLAEKVAGARQSRISREGAKKKESREDLVPSRLDVPSRLRVKIDCDAAPALEIKASAE
jgi:hypothetical protein